jgi:Xaa-Pro aminopeptidase
MKVVKIPEYEYAERREKAASLVREMNLDVLVVNSTESDFANVRYFSGFWPLFERAGVAISATGQSALLVGLESEIFAKDMGHIDNIHVLMEYRESADPSAPHFKPNTFKDSFKSIGVTGEKIRIGVAAWIDTTMVMMDGIKECYPHAEIVRADEIMVKLRSLKSSNEIACIRHGFTIVEYATQEVIKALKPGVSECQMVGVAQRAIYEKGAEYEGLPMYVFSEKSTSHAISRSRPDRIIGDNDIVQLNLSARVDGYSPSIGMPLCMGKIDPARKKYIDFCLEVHNWTKQQLKPGKAASEICKEYFQFFVDAGYEDNYVYGPCHGTGMIEVEPPWMESNSTYLLEPNMCFQVDSFISGPGFGARWELGATITSSGVEIMTQPVGKFYELG